MKISTFSHFSTTISLIAMLCMASCKTARFEIIRPGSGKKTSPTGTINDEKLPPAPPSAGIQVAKDGVIYSRLPVNTEASIEPTKDTVDGDNRNSPCLNAGIVQAAYKVGGKDAGNVTRPKGCEPLGKSYKFTELGTFELQLEVTTDEGEKAVATTVIEIFDPSATSNNDDGTHGNNGDDNFKDRLKSR